jgi:CheY-like chemotaxis protein
MATAAHVPRVLIVDDEESVLTFTGDVLRNAGYDTLVARSGTDALAVAAAHVPVDLLLTDVVMPGMRGDDLVKLLRETQPGVAVIYMTGHINELLRLQPALPDDEMILAKPYSVKALCESISLQLFGHPRGLSR